jgi:peptide/nickel transport system substrate-binding protein
MADGNFGSATSHWSNSSIEMYGVYQGWLESSLDAKNTSNDASGDYEGLDNPTMNKDLKVLAGQTTTAGTVKAITPIEKFVARDLPVIPTVYGASFDEYNSGAFSGWPTKSNPYESGSPNTPTNEVIVLHLKPTS